MRNIKIQTNTCNHTGEQTIKLRLLTLILDCWQFKIMTVRSQPHTARLPEFLCKGNGKGQYICIAPYCRTPTSEALGFGNALSRDLTVLPAHPRVYPRTEQTIPAFAYPARAGTQLPTPKGWKAELAWATKTVSKQSTQDCYAMFIAAANRSKHHASLGK